MGLTPDDLQELLAAFEQSSWQEMTVSVAGDTLHVSRREGDGRPADVAPAATAGSSAAPAPPPDRPLGPPGAPPPAPPGAPQPDPVPVPGAGAVPAPPETSGVSVAAPSVGLFWRSPSPGAPPFVDVGTRVGPEDVVGIVEVMKLMNRVTAGISGVVTAVLVENGGMVEHGQPLVLIDPVG